MLNQPLDERPARPQPPSERRQEVKVQGTVFARRPDVIDRLQEGDALVLVPDLLSEDEPPAVWVHVSGGDVLGHVPVQVAAWLAPYLLDGGRCRAQVSRVRGPESPSWERVAIELVR
jgi:hypothetical protein